MLTKTGIKHREGTVFSTSFSKSKEHFSTRSCQCSSVTLVEQERCCSPHLFYLFWLWKEKLAQPLISAPFYTPSISFPPNESTISSIIQSIVRSASLQMRKGAGQQRSERCFIGNLPLSRVCKPEHVHAHRGRLEEAVPSTFDVCTRTLEREHINPQVEGHEERSN